MSWISTHTRPSRRALALVVVLLTLASLGLPGQGLAGATSRGGHGLLSVGTAPALGAAIVVDGEVRNNGAIKGLELSTGRHDVCFGSVKGYLAPSCHVVDITEGAGTSVTGTFVKAGQLTVDVAPADLDPMITVAGIERDRGATSFAVAEGTQEVCFEALDGYEAVDCQQVSVTHGATASVVGSYTELTPPPVDEEEGADDSARVSADLISLYDFMDGSGSNISDVAGNVDGLDLNILDTSRVSWTEDGLRFNKPTLARTANPPAALYDAVRASGEFSVEAWVTPANTTQNGPARIVTLSKDTSNSNFLLGQGEYKGVGSLIESRLHLRSGDYKAQTSAGTVSTGLTHLVLTRSADATVRIFVDGELKLEKKMASNLDGWNPSYLLGIGAEHNGDRAWLGTYHLVALYGGALDAGEVTTNFTAGPKASTLTTPGDTVAHGAGLLRTQVGLPDGWKGTSKATVTSTHDGQVIEGLNVSVSGGSAIVVKHNNVTVRNNRVNHRDGANGVVVESGVKGAVIAFNDFEGHYRTQTGNHGSIGVLAYGEIDARRNHFRGGRDGLHVYGPNSDVTENWIKDLHHNDGAHNDSIYVGGWKTYGNVTIARNRTVAGNSGAIDMYALRGPIQGVEIVDNLVIGEGKGFGIYGGRTHTHYMNNKDIKIEGNRFTGTFGYPKVRGGGSNTAVDLGRSGNTFTNNRWLSGGGDLPARCGISQDNCQ